MQTLIWVLLGIVALLLLAAGYEALAGAATLRCYPPTGRLIDIGGRRLHIHVTGAGTGPTVVIEPGRFNTSLMWTLVQHSIAPFARVVTYDRAGYAWSDADAAPRTGERVAEDLHTLLQKAEIPGPYLLVGHSLGALYMRCFAERYPDEVAGIILVDPYTEGEIRRHPPKVKAMQDRFGPMMNLVSRFGVARLAAPFMTGMKSELRRFPAAVQAQIVALSVNHRLWHTVDREWRELDGLAGRIGGTGSLGEKPLLVLSAARRDMKPGGGFSEAEVEELWRLQKESQADLVHLSSRGRLVMLPDTGHGVPLERPEAIVEAVRELIR